MDLVGCVVWGGIFSLEEEGNGSLFGEGKWKGEE